MGDDARRGRRRHAPGKRAGIARMACQPPRQHRALGSGEGVHGRIGDVGAEMLS